MSDKPVRPGDISFRVRVRRALHLGRTSPQRRLYSSVTEYRRELAKRIAEHRRDGAPDPPWAETAQGLLDEADDAIDRGDLDTGHACLLGAQRVEVTGMDPVEVRAAATGVLKEASSEKIGGWRGKAIVALLEDLGKESHDLAALLTHLQANAGVMKDIESAMEANGGVARRRAAVAEALSKVGGATPGVTDRVATLLVDLGTERRALKSLLTTLAATTDCGDERGKLQQAMRMRDEGFLNEYRKIDKMRQQLMLLGVALAVVLVGIYSMTAWLPISLKASSPLGARLAAYAALFGALGGCLTAIVSVIRSGTSARIPQLIIQGSVVLVRPMFGAAAALALYTFLQAGLIEVASNSNAAVLAVSFVAGFSERIISYAVGTVAPRSPEGAQS